MGAVYKARQKSLDREVAIKVLPHAIDEGDMRFAERFVAEARAMGRLEHPGIIAVYDAGTSPSGLLYFVMQYVQGTDVAQMIRAAGKLPAEHAYAITAHVCEALGYAHANGLIHRDIKPANIMVDMQGRVKIADFGLAKVVTEDSGFTQSNMAVGTPDFVAPEALIPGVSLDGRADLYAVGVMLYQMLTGSLPRGAWHPASVMVPGLDIRFDQIILKAMQCDREQRHDSAMVLRQHLDSILMPVPSAPDLQRYSAEHIPKTPPAQPQAELSSKPVIKPPQSRGAGLPAAQAGVVAPQSRQYAGAPMKSKTPLFIGLGVATLLAAGAFVRFNGLKIDLTGLTKTKAERDHPSQIAESLSPASNKAVESPKPGFIAKTFEPPKVETKKEETKPIAVAPGLEKSVQSVVVEQSSPTLSIVPTAPKQPALAAPPHSEGQVALLPPELAALDAAFTKLQAERVIAPFEADYAKLNNSYLGGIAKKAAEEKAAGHLDAILALEAEQALIKAKQPIPDTDDELTSAIIKALRDIYRTAYAKLVAARASKFKALTEPLDARLTAMESEFTKRDRLADAKIVRSYREVLKASRPEVPFEASQQIVSETLRAQSGLMPSSAMSPVAILVSKIGYINTLGMKFLRVKGTEVMFCIHETRRKDYAIYASEAQGVDETWKTQQRKGIPCGDKDDHPVVGVNWDDAQKFCKWLSKKEGKTYRLPTDEEWSIAVGLEQKEKHGKDITPEMLNGKETTEFPWGDSYPPKTEYKAGNFSDTAWIEKFPLETGRKDYTDGFATTAPVMSFKPNKFGLFDMGGNVWEWEADSWSDTSTDQVLRGGSYDRYSRSDLLSSNRYPRSANHRGNSYGFRVVIVMR